MSGPLPPPPPAPPAGAASRASWYVGILALIILAYILVNSLRTPDNEPPRARSTLPPFAAPEVRSGLDGDANVATPGATGEDAGTVPACEVRGDDVVNSCDLVRDRPLVLGFLFTRGARCAGSFDTIERLQARHPRVRFAGVIVRGDRDEARELVREQGWTFPIAYDRDGLIANLYGVVGCPNVVLADAGGRVRETVLGGDRAERGLEGHVTALERAR